MLVNTYEIRCSIQPILFVKIIFIMIDKLNNNLQDSKKTTGKVCREASYADFSIRLLDLANRGRERSSIIKYFMHSTDTWVVLLNIVKAHYQRKSISISDSLKGTLFTKESGIAFIKKSSEGNNCFLKIFDDATDKRKKTVTLTKDVKDAFENYCNKLSACVDDPNDSNHCVKVL